MFSPDYIRSLLSVESKDSPNGECCRSICKYNSCEGKYNKKFNFFTNYCTYCAVRLITLFIDVIGRLV